MKSNHPKLKTTPRPLFSCGFFRHCTQTMHSPTNSTPSPPSLTQSFSPTPPLPQAVSSSSSSSSSASITSQSFTQWKFPLRNSPITHDPHPLPNTGTGHGPEPTHESGGHGAVPQLPILASNLEELFHMAELQFTTGSGQDRFSALHLLERSLVPNPRAGVDGGSTPCPSMVMRGVVDCLKERVGSKAASKILLALCLEEGNRRVGVEVGAVGAVVDVLTDLEVSVAERALAALELLCTVAEGAAEVREHALAVPMMVQIMGRMEGMRGKEYAISVLAVIYGGSGVGAAVAPPEEVARAVILALRGDCSARARRKGAQLLKVLQDEGRLDLNQDGTYAVTSCLLHNCNHQ